jgi:hypothetical protein
MNTAQRHFRRCLARGDPGAAGLLDDESGIPADLLVNGREGGGLGKQQDAAGFEDRFRFRRTGDVRSSRDDARLNPSGIVLVEHIGSRGRDPPPSLAPRRAGR